jgi:hypothetical protein
MAAALVILFALATLAGASQVVWVLVHLWVAMRMDAKLARRDYVRLALGVLMLGGGLFAMVQTAKMSQATRDAAAAP